MTDAAKELGQMAETFEQRRAKLSSAAACAMVDARRSSTETERRAASVYVAELQAQINELTHVIDRLRDRVTALRSDATEAA